MTKSPPARVVWIEIVKPDLLNRIQIGSPPARVVWIEIAPTASERLKL